MVTKTVSNLNYVTRRLNKGTAVTKPANSTNPQFKEKLVGFKSNKGQWVFVLNGLNKRDLEKILMEKK